MMNRRSFLQSSAMGLPALALTPHAIRRASPGEHPIVKHMMREQVRAYRQWHSRVPAREALALRSFATNARLLQAYGSGLNFSALLDEAQTKVKANPTRAQAKAHTHDKTAQAWLKQHYGILTPQHVEVQPLALLHSYTKTLDFDKVMQTTSRLFDALATTREQPPVQRMRLQDPQPDQINICLSNDADGLCETTDQPAGDPYDCSAVQLMTKVMMFVGYMIGGFWVGPEAWLIGMMFQIDALALSGWMYYIGC